MTSLSDELQLSNDLTFRDFFNHLMREKTDLNKAFFSTLRGYKIEDYKHDLTTQGKKPRSTGLRSVQVGWRVEVTKDGLEIRHDFQGVGQEGGGNRENGIETTYGLSLTPLYEYCDLPFRLNERFVIEDYQGKKVKEVLKSKRLFTVFEVLDAILYEITWDGTPQQRDKRAKKLMKRLKKAEKQIAEGKYITHEEVKKKLGDRFESLKKDD